MSQFHEVTVTTIVRKWRFIAFVITMLASLTFLVGALIPPTYESRAQFMILQKNINIDAYRAAKASEYAGDVMKRVISSSNFMDGILEDMLDIKARLGKDQREQLESWNDAVKVTTVVNTGIINVQVLNESRKEGRYIMEALVAGLLEDGVRYHGNENIVLKKIGGPVYYDSPAYPLIWVNTGIAGLFGFFLATGLIFIFGEKVDVWMYARKPRIKVTAERDPFRSQEGPKPEPSTPAADVIKEDSVPVIEPVSTITTEPSFYSPRDYSERLKSILGEK